MVSKGNPPGNSLCPIGKILHKLPHFGFACNIVGLLQKGRSFFSSQYSKALHGLRILPQCEAEPKGKFVLIHAVTPAF